MRLHRLEVTAFGPFPGTETVDFDSLSEAGLFLLTGPTGAGKTSVLDAVCFALYGAVPGARNAARWFKSDHADAGAAPQVVLEATIRGRRFRFRRSPVWRRPSTRARTGSVEQKTKASAEELVDGEWVALTNRVDDVGLLVRELLHMNHEQFCQVVMLPQGQFETFLRAGAKERHDVLEALFDTRRFHDVERWLVEHRRERDQACQRQQRIIDDQVSRALEVCGGPLTANTDDLSDSAAVSEALRQRLADLVAAVVDADDRCTGATDAAKAARHALDEARLRAERQGRHAEARRRLDELTAADPAVRERERRVERARAAQSFVPLLELLTEAETAVGHARLRRREVLDHLPEHDAAEPSGADVDHRIEEARRDLVAVEALRSVELEASRLDRDVTVGRDETDRLRARLEVEASRLAELPAALDDLRRRQSAAAVIAAGRPSAVERHHACETAAAAVLEVMRLEERLHLAEEEHLTAREQLVDARATSQDLRERRLAGMAAELAAGLRARAPCPVCGSGDHPALATPSGGSVSPDDESAAAELVSTCEASVQRLTERAAELRLALVAARQASKGMDAAQVADALASATSRLDDCDRAGAEVDALDIEIRTLSADEASCRLLVADMQSKVAVATERNAAVGRRLAELRDHLSAALGEGAKVTDRVTKLKESLSALQAVFEAERALRSAERSLDAPRRRLASDLSESVFADERAVRDAVLPAHDVTNEDALNRHHHAELTATRRLLASPELESADREPVPDLPALEEACQTATALAEQAVAAAVAVTERHRRLTELLASLDRELAAARPLLAARDLAETVASMCAGTSRDNLIKARLSHYVVAARLEQVVAAANVRLAGICGGRYLLEHRLDKGAGETRGGLGLRVVDAYTDQRRDPVTLSGGETFYVSLALALGLADLVSHEVGGTELATLFVDEGFGSLDSETLDEVMDELDSLRSGGRCVGLVSHLGELRLRIPTQLRVIRRPDGSRLSQTDIHD